MIKHFRVAPNGYIKKDGTHTKAIESFTVEVWQQPFWRWLVAVVYHWYDMRIYKVPGFKRLEAVLAWFHRNEPFIYVPLSCQQDIRCYDLDRKNKAVLATFEVTKDSEIVKESGWG